MKLNKTHTSWGVAAATLTMAGALVSPQAAAASKAEHALQATASKVQATDSKVQALEAQVNQMSQMLQSMQDELTRVRSAASRSATENTAKVQELDQWMASVKSAPAASTSKDNMVFFRGGWADMDHDREGVSIASDSVVNGALGNLGGRGDNDGWYIGAGFDFSLNDDLFGLMDNTEVLAELMFEWKDFGYTAGNNLTDTTNSVSVSQFTLSAAPKIKFMKGSALRPWVIPFGLAAHVISPPSEQITVFNPGIMFGGGADYHLWNNIYVGVDARYHLTGGNGDGVNTDGYTAGGYLGIGF